jgi:hypothetical protein
LWEHVTGGVGPPPRKDASRSVRPEPRSARHSLAARVRAQARGPAPAEGREATDWTPPRFPLGARHGTSCPPRPPPRVASSSPPPGSYPPAQPHRRRGAGRARRGPRDVVQCPGTAAQADKAARSHHVKWRAIIKRRVGQEVTTARHGALGRRQRPAEARSSVGGGGPRPAKCRRRRAPDRVRVRSHSRRVATTTTNRFLPPRSQPPPRIEIGGGAARRSLADRQATTASRRSRRASRGRAWGRWGQRA